jgi:hypothetical protein
VAEKKQKRQPHVGIDQVWLIRLPNASALMKVLVRDTTTKAVQVREYAGFGEGAWYLKADVEFIERIR